MGSDFIGWLEQANLFVILLGKDGEKWVRHHHLFRKLLEKLLNAISVATAKRHVANINEKLEVHGRRHAVTRALVLNILPARTIG